MMLDREDAARQPALAKPSQADSNVRRATVLSAGELNGGGGHTRWYIRRHSFDGVVDRVNLVVGEHAREGGVDHEVAVGRHGAAAGEGSATSGIRRQRANTMLSIYSSASQFGEQSLTPAAEDHAHRSPFADTMQGAVVAMNVTPLSVEAAIAPVATLSGEPHREACGVASRNVSTSSKSVEGLRNDLGGGDASVKTDHECAVAGVVAVAGDGKHPALSLRPLAGRCCFHGCGKATVFRCRRCRSAYYCSRDHQREHWEQHRLVCEEGKGSPPPPLARLVLPLPPPPPPLPPPPPSRPQTKAVGWADSTQLFMGAQPPSYDQVSTAPASFSGAFSKIGATSQVSREKYGGRGRGGTGRFGGGSNARAREAGAQFQQIRSRMEAAMASSKPAVGGFDTQLRNSRGGTSWVVPTSNGGGGGRFSGSAEVWPASSSAAATGAVGSGSGHRGRSASLSPSSRPCPPPPPSHIPPPASRPADVLFCSSVDMLSEMGFERALAEKALRSCGGNVERAAEWLLTEIGSGTGGDGGGNDDAHTHSQGLGRCEGMHMRGTEDWGGGTELRKVVGETGEKRGSKDGDDDLITTADPTDVGQVFDITDFWQGETTVQPGGVGAAGLGGAFDRETWGETSGLESVGEQGLGGTGGGDEAKTVGEDGDNDGDDLVISYEDFVGGAPADIVVFYREKGSTIAGKAIPAAAAAAAATPLASSGNLKATCEVVTRVATRSFEVDGVAGRAVGDRGAASGVLHGSRGCSAPEVGGAGGGGVDGDAKMTRSSGRVLTVIVRPLPSTAPASLDSDSSRGEDFDRNDSSGDVEHVVELPWEEAEHLVHRHQVAQRLRTESAKEAADVAGIARDDPLHPSAWPLSRQPSTPLLSPLSPLPPRSAALAPDSLPPPSWRRKSKVGRLIAGMLERRADGGFQAVASEVSEANRSDLEAAGGEVLVVRTLERPRGRALPKWGRHGDDSVVGMPPPPPPRQPPLPPVSKWSSVDSRLDQAWDCQVCTFFNENPAFRTTCEICDRPRPIGASGGLLSTGFSGDWQKLPGEAPPPQHESDGNPPALKQTSLATPTAGLPSLSATASVSTSLVADTYRSVDSVAVGGSDDDDVVDGILGGVSPGGVGSPIYATAIAVQEPAGTVGGPKRIDWDGGTEWQEFESASFGKSP